MKAYLDTNVVSALGKGDVSPLEIAILQELLSAFEAQNLDLVTSSLTATEIARYNGVKKPDIENVYARLGKVPFVKDHEVVGFHNYWDRFGGESYPFVQDDQTSSALRQMDVKRTDAHHLMLGVRAGCERFITYDGGILHRSSDIRRAFPIIAVRPSELLTELKATAVHK